ncbi:MAG: carbamoyltransferase [Flavobacteriales bacterium]|jgi:carbamoyltransferase
MLILGITRGNLHLSEDLKDTSNIVAHDSSAALIKDGAVISAIEEERLNRVKHSNKHPTLSIRSMFENTEYSINDVDKICVFSMLERYENHYRLQALKQREAYISQKQKIINLIYDATGYTVGEDKICFVPHQLSHSMLSYFQSGYEDSLIASFDGIGDGLSGQIYHSDGQSISLIHTLPAKSSLGNFYNAAIEFLGYGMFDEYKVMGMAPYGDPNVFKEDFDNLYSLLPNGEIEIHWGQFDAFTNKLSFREDHLTKEQKDFSIGLQLTLEKLMLHILSHYQTQTQSKNLCLSGGVAFNCSSNGNIIKKNIFDKVFVHPASHDAGGALGAALCGYHLDDEFSLERASYAIKPSTKKYAIDSVYWGKDIGENATIEDQLRQWSGIIEFEKHTNIATTTAELLANDNVLGWVQGRSEYGPRALGNRSILADPRPEKNKTRINKMVKLREGYRPFAPSVLKEYASDYYDFPNKGSEFPFMTVILEAKEEKRQELGAVTHIDGTARVQTVTKNNNAKYWNLINEFRKLTGTPILLNTSFNNNVEPIVDSIEDSIVCFLTTQINYLVIGDYLISKNDIESNISNLQVSKLCYSIIEERNGKYQIYFNNSHHKKITITKQIFKILVDIEGRKLLKDILATIGSKSERDEVITDMIRLWGERIIRIAP